MIKKIPKFESDRKH